MVWYSLVFSVGTCYVGFLFKFCDVQKEKKYFLLKGRVTMEGLSYISQLHRVELEIMDEIARVCNKNNLRYCITAGTLLGAVRHGGFIPWDDDADIVMPREDYIKFCSISKKEMKPEFFVDAFYTENNCFRLFGKVRKRNTIFLQEDVGEPRCDLHNEIWIDIFPLDNADSSIEIMEKKKRILGKLKNILVIKMTKVNTRRFKRIASSLCPTRLIQLLINMIMMSGSKKSDCYINYGSQYSVQKQTIKKDVYFPATQIKFEDRVYAAPAQVETLLTKLYGRDYMQIPPEEKRRTHKPIDLCFDVENRNKNMEEQ
jgi:lipopolysaccharide cholinephosphotransferase